MREKNQRSSVLSILRPKCSGLPALWTVALCIALATLGTSTRAQADATTSCTDASNRMTGKAWELANRVDLSGAAQAYMKAAQTLERCLKEHPSEKNTTAEKRLAEVWMYAGEYETRSGNAALGAQFLTRQKPIFERLRGLAGNVGEPIDELRHDAYEDDEELMLAEAWRCFSPPGAAVGDKIRDAALRNDWSAARALEADAAKAFGQCILDTHNQSNVLAQKRLGDLWRLSAGDAVREGNLAMARQMALHAESIFERLRAAKGLSPSMEGDLMMSKHMADLILQQAAAPHGGPSPSPTASK